LIIYCLFERQIYATASSPRAQTRTSAAIAPAKQETRYQHNTYNSADGEVTAA
jgi:hypothetical protein